MEETFNTYICLVETSWLASVASETLTGVKMKKSGMFIYLSSERSERDTTSDVLEHKWRASLKTIIFLYE